MVYRDILNEPYLPKRIQNYVAAAVKWHYLFLCTGKIIKNGICLICIKK